MVQLKAYSLFILVIITLINSCGNQKTKDDKLRTECKQIVMFQSNDTDINLQKDEFSLSKNGNLYELSILNKSKLDSIKEMQNSTIIFCVENAKKVAKGNFIFSSSVPNGSDYFFAIDKEKKIILIQDNIIKFSKTPTSN